MSEDDIANVLTGVAEAGGVTGMLAVILIAIVTLFLKKRRQRVSFSCSTCASEPAEEGTQPCTQTAASRVVDSSV
jgi:hypothetical protein